MMTQENIRSDAGKEKGSVFHADLESLRRENQRLHQNLARALEERNRLLKKLSQVSATTGHSNDSRILDQRLEELRLELMRQKRENRELDEENHRLQDWVGSNEKYQGLLLERLEGMAAPNADETQSTPDSQATQSSDQHPVAERFDAAIRGIWRRLDDKKSLMDGVLSHEIKRLRAALREKQAELETAASERGGLTEKITTLQTRIREDQAHLDEQARETTELKTERSELNAQKEQLTATISRLQLRIRRLHSGRGLGRLRTLARNTLDDWARSGSRGRVITVASIVTGCVCGIILALAVAQYAFAATADALPAGLSHAEQIPAGN